METKHKYFVRIYQTLCQILKKVEKTKIKVPGSEEMQIECDNYELYLVTIWSKTKFNVTRDSFLSYRVVSCNV